MQTGEQATLEFAVTEADTAAALGSGDLPVLGTPRLLAWCEAATCAVLMPGLPPGRTSVGTRVRLDHVRATPVGAVVRVTATTAYVDGRLVRFEVVAEQLGAAPAQDVTVVGHGEITRVVVDGDRFLSRL